MQVCREIKNFFEISEESGKFKIENRIIHLNEQYLVGQYIAVTGSILNNGIYLLNDALYTLENSADEEFEGTVYGLQIPRDFIALVDEIKTSVEKTPQGGFVSEKFGNYSYTLAMNSKGNAVTWIDTYSDRLNKYRKMFYTIKI